MHQDVGSVTCLDICHTTDTDRSVGIKLSNFRSLLHLRLKITHSLTLDVLQDLENSPEICPHLSLMDFFSIGSHFYKDAGAKAEAQAKLMMQSRVDKGGRLVKVSYFPSGDYYSKAPTMVDRFKSFRFCECNSPDHPQQDLYHKKCFLDDYELDST